MESITETEGTITDTNLKSVFNRMVTILKSMHMTNPACSKVLKKLDVALKIVKATGGVYLRRAWAI